jgi:hypothetical protein
VTLLSIKKSTPEGRPVESVDVSLCKALAGFPEAALNPSQVNKLLAKIESLNVCAGRTS